MDFVDVLNKAQDIVAVLLVAVPGAMAALSPWLAKLGRARPIIKELLASLKDKEMADEEMATILWMLLTILVGVLPNKSLWILKYAPGHQVQNLVDKGFITQTQADAYLITGA